MLYTTKDLAEGRIVLIHNGNLEHLKRVINEAFPLDTIPNNIISAGGKYFFQDVDRKDFWESVTRDIDIPLKYKTDHVWVNEDRILTMAEFRGLSLKDFIHNPNPETPSIQNLSLTILPPDLQEAINTLGRYGIPVDIEISINGKKIVP